jgi:protein-tyrosine phosphatase
MIKNYSSLLNKLILRALSLRGTSREMQQPYTRQISFKSIYNFRDLGGYQTKCGRPVIWRRLFRSGELHKINENDLDQLQVEIGLKSVLDLRSDLELREKGVGLISLSGFKYFNVSLISDGGDKEGNQRRYQNLTNMGEFYIKLSRQKEFGRKIIEALEVIANPINHPLVFHCSAGKDRTGILAALVLDFLGVSENDIAADYSLTALHPQEPFNRINGDVVKQAEKHGLPLFFWEVSPELILLYLAKLREEYGSCENYLQVCGARSSLLNSLKNSLLV